MLELDRRTARATRRRASAIKAMQSADVAPPAFSMKFAWRGEIERAADPVALEAALLDHPARAPSSGARVLEDAAERPLVRRLRRLALRRGARDRRLHRLRRARLEPKPHRAPRPDRPRAPSGDRTVELVRHGTVRAPSASTTTASTSTSRHSRPYAPAFMRTPPPAVPGSPTRTRTRRDPLPRAGVDTPRWARRRPRRARRRRRRAAASPPASLITSASTPSSWTSTFEPSPITSTATPAVARPAQRLLQLVDRLRAREPARGAAGADRRVPRERDVLLDHAVEPSREPGPVDVAGAERRAGRHRCGHGGRGAPRPARPSASTPRARRGRTARRRSSLPVTPGTGSSRAA